MSKRIRLLLMAAVILVTHISAFVIVRQKLNLIQDEVYHYNQIVQFASGNFEFNPGLMTVPGFHLLISAFVKPFGKVSINLVRIIVFSLNLSSIGLFYCIVRKLDERNALVKTLQFSFFPIIFPFFPLIYTDIVSITMVLLSFYLMIHKRFVLSAVFSILSIFIRQNNIFWLLFINILMYVRSHGFQLKRNFILTHIKKSWLFVLGVIILGVFIFLNGGVVVSDYAKSYVKVSFSLLGNFYFLLFACFLLFLPLNIANFYTVLKVLSKNKKILAMLVLALVFFLLTFVNDHPFNQATWFLRNYLLVTITGNIFYKIVFFVVCAYCLFSIGKTKLLSNEFNLLYPFTFIYLLPYWLIEVRYFFIPIVFFLLFKKNKTAWVELPTIVFYIILSAIFVDGIANWRFFL